MNLPTCSFIFIKCMQCFSEYCGRHPSLRFRLFWCMKVNNILKLFIVLALALKKVGYSSKVIPELLRCGLMLHSGVYFCVS